MDCSLPGSSVHGISQARVLEWVAIPFCRGSSRPRDQTQFSCIKGKFFTIWATREASMIKVLCFVLFCFWRPYHLEIQAKVFIGDMAWCLGFTLKYPVKGLPWWLSGKEFTCQCRRHRFNPWSRKISHTMEQPSLWATITEPMCHNYWNPHPRAHALQQEKLLQWEACTP